MLARICWGALAALHVLPALALFRPALVSTLYGVPAGSDTALLLRHRAALFMAVVVVCLWAAVRPEVRQLASVAVALSMLSFLALYWAGGAPPSLRTIAVADLLGLPFLALGAWAAFRPA